MSKPTRQPTVFQSKHVATEKSLNLKVPADRHERIAAIKSWLAEVAPHRLFNVSAICQAALETAVRQAERELKGLAAGAPPASAPPSAADAVATATAPPQGERWVADNPP
jgi:hypothetical protein